jgi:uncharacterized membrane protein
LKALFGIFKVLLIILYPVAVYFGLSRFDLSKVGLVLIILVGLGLLPRIKSLRQREQLSAILPLPLSIAGLILLSMILDDPRFILGLPVLINLVLLFGFARSLKSEESMIERFARMQSPDLSEEQQGYCRSVTLVWCGFFVINASIAGTLALLFLISWWTLYTGLISYLLMVVLFSAEYIIRKYRFREYGNRAHDRLISVIFPPKESK